MNDGVCAGVGVAIVAPGGYAPDEMALSRAEALLASYGCHVKSYYEPAAKHQRFGGTDDARIGQIHAAANDPDIQVVLSLRGGYGMSRLLHAIDFSMLAASGKLFVGHSDFTAFQMGLLVRTGAVSFSGPMICDDFSRPEPSDFTLHHFWQCLRNPECTVRFEVRENPVVDVSGVLWGGNLAMLAHLAGTPYLPQIDNGILFVEDINEHPYRVERMLLQLFHAGVLSRQKAIVFGDFSNYRLSDYDNGYDFAAMLAYLRAQLNVPVLTGLPFGHIRDKVTLPVGCTAHLVSNGESIRLTMSGYPFLSLTNW
ncbi:muramoyltetrapeptide carboxypeptidase [Noviherbaspirillum cavernae]|uniref:muramoyltetrapeptide carboxypeptidase n=1 Tax=Noviherbaspirillum cavernae TaxID=2320862 RepID=UPI002413E6EF|nr:muramoyltetrapeptide carboxypeptidase [Noviherbaspirillum cavernae]